MAITIRTALQNDIDDMLPLLEQLFAIEADFKFDKQIQARGLALMLEAIEDWAGMRDIVSLQLLADRDNHKGLDFYKARGWASTALVCLVKPTG